jgi:hypothetical protein
MSNDRTGGTFSGDGSLRHQPTVGAGAGRGVGDSRGGKRKEFEDHVKTKPEHILTKVGTSGKPVPLSANVFKIDEKADLQFNQYRVDFEPEVDVAIICKALVGKHLSSFGGKKKSNGKLPKNILCNTLQKKFKLIFNHSRLLL